MGLEQLCLQLDLQAKAQLWLAQAEELVEEPLEELYHHT
jgi:hypothetical protein